MYIAGQLTTLEMGLETGYMPKDRTIRPEQRQHEAMWVARLTLLGLQKGKLAQNNDWEMIQIIVRVTMKGVAWDRRTMIAPVLLGSHAARRRLITPKLSFALVANSGRQRR